MEVTDFNVSGDDLEPEKVISNANEHTYSFRVGNTEYEIAAIKKNEDTPVQLQFAFYNEDGTATGEPTVRVVLSTDFVQQLYHFLTSPEGMNRFGLA